MVPKLSVPLPANPRGTVSSALADSASSSPLFAASQLTENEISDPTVAGAVQRISSDGGSAFTNPASEIPTAYASAVTPCGKVPAFTLSTASPPAELATCCTLFSADSEASSSAPLPLL